MRRAAVLVLLAPLAAMAMHITSRQSLLAFSDDGLAALVETTEDGPEGGGSLAFAIIAARAPFRLQFPVSSDFSPGGGSRPQRVSTADCQQTAQVLTGALRKLQFSGVEVNAAVCTAAHGRSGFVQVDDVHTRQVASAWLSGAELEAARLTAKAGPRDRMARSPSGKLLVAIPRDDDR
jgi:hypothetical protein